MVPTGHHQSSGGNQARILYEQLTSLGCKVWYDNAVAPGERNLDGMRRGVRESVTFLIFLSGRKWPDLIRLDLSHCHTAVSLTVSLEQARRATATPTQTATTKGHSLGGFAMRR